MGNIRFSQRLSFNTRYQVTSPCVRNGCRLGLCALGTRTGHHTNRREVTERLRHDLQQFGHWALVGGGDQEQASEFGSCILTAGNVR